MVELHFPLLGTSVAAALERDVPSPAREHAEAVALPLGRADAPACRCRDDAFAVGSQEQQWQLCVAGGVQQVRVTVKGGYSPDVVAVRAGRPGLHKQRRELPVPGN